MRTIAIMPGRYNPPHPGHKVLYDKLVNKFGAENTFVATSNKQDAEKSPFSFVEKKALWEALGVPSSQIIQTRIPYTPTEITSKVDGDNTAIVFALGKKDAERFAFQPKKDGTPSYMQPYNKPNLAPLNQTGYILIAPTVTFPVAGKKTTSASEIRNMYGKANEKTRDQILTDLYGQAKPAVKKLFNKRLAPPVTETLLKEYVEYINKI